MTIKIRLQYPIQTEDQPFQLLLTNESDNIKKLTLEGITEQDTLTFTWLDKPTQRSDFHHKVGKNQGWVALPSHTEFGATFTVEPSHPVFRNKFLKPKDFPFQVRVTTEAGDWLEVGGMVEIKPFLSRTTIFLVVSLFSLCGLLSLSSFFGYEAVQAVQATNTAKAIAQLSPIEQLQIQATTNAQQFSQDIASQPQNAELQLLATQVAQELQDEIDQLAVTVTPEATLDSLDDVPVATLAILTIEYLLDEEDEIPQDTPVDSTIGLLSAPIGNEITFTLVEGDEFFRIVGNQLQLQEKLEEAEAVQIIRIRAENEQGDVVERSFRLDVVDD